MWLRQDLNIKALQEPGEHKVSSIVTGLLERLLFTFLVAFDISGTAIAMIVWLATKMTINWDKISHPKDNPEIRSLTLSALLAGLVSMFFALVGGLVCRGQLWP